MMTAYPEINNVCIVNFLSPVVKWLAVADPGSSRREGEG